MQLLFTDLFNLTAVYFMVYENIITDENCEKLMPYEKCLELGANALSNAELLAAIIRTGTRGLNSVELSERILSEFGDLNGLHDISVADFMSVKGIGRAKAVQICCILELSRRIAKQKARQRLDFSNASSIAEYYMEDMRHLEKEHLILVMLDSRCRLIKDKIMSIGTSNGSMVSVREIFKEALDNRAAFIVLLHNHPSGNPAPSREDMSVTRNVAEAGKVIGIELADHIVIGDNSYFSFKQMKYI